ncbi:hypothetical protein ACQ4PT_004837 [Festuca glaucescens]
MVLTHLLLVGAALALSFLSGSEAGEVGVCYGMMARNLIKPPAVVELLKRNGIKVVTLYDADPGALSALANTGIKVGVSLPNQYLADAAGDMSYARQWVQSNVKAYSKTLIDSVAVGNEVFHQVPGLTPQLLPAMKNIQAALASTGLADAVKTGSYLSFNIYPYFAYKAKPHEIDLNFVLFRTNNGHLDPQTGLTYYNLFDAMVDAVFHAVEKLSKSRQRTRSPGTGRMLGSSDDLILESFRVKELGKILRGTGTPYKPNAVISANIFSLFNEDLKPGNDDERNFGLFNPDGTPVYEVDFVRPGPAPAPAAPSWCTANVAVGNKRLQNALDYACGHGADCSAIQPGKPCYQPNTLVAHASYAFDAYYQTCNGNAASWCVANAAAGDTRLQAALDYACGHGADCRAIQRGGRCFDPNTKVAHASYAFNAYYQHNGRSDQSCDFGGCGSVVHQQPSECTLRNATYSSGSATACSDGLKHVRARSAAVQLGQE